MNRSLILKSCLITISVFSLISVSCASKKFVFGKVDPLDKRVKQLETEAAETGTELGELRTALSKTDERAVTADAKADEANKQAAEANQSAGTAGRLAEDAGSQATRNTGNLGQLDRKIDSLDDYDFAESATVHFGFDSVSISEDEQQKLDRVAESLNENIPYSVEIQGFTDGTGQPGYNLALSQKRADAVARYLSVEHEVPLRRIHILGMGSAEPTGDNSTSDGRKLNRRVEVRLYVQRVVAADLQ